MVTTANNTVISATSISPTRESHSFRAANLKTKHDSNLSIDEINGRHLKLSQLLQTSLDVGRILQLFFNELEASYGIASLGYRHEASNSCINIGSSGTHSCSYSLNMNEQCLGDLILSRSQRFSEDDLGLIEALIGSLVCPIRNALLYQKALQAAVTDPLTQLGNRQALNQHLAREINMAERHEQPLSLIMLDIDWFKSINDQYGHLMGDKVIKKVAELLRQQCRDCDLSFRYGGEEFCIILQQTSLQGGLCIADRIREAIALEHFEHGSPNKGFNITASFGISQLNIGESAEALMQRADEALYCSKNNGRNCLTAAN